MCSLTYDFVRGLVLFDLLDGLNVRVGTRKTGFYSLQVSPCLNNIHNLLWVVYANANAGRC